MIIFKVVRVTFRMSGSYQDLYGTNCVRSVIHPQVALLHPHTPLSYTPTHYKQHTHPSPDTHPPPPTYTSPDPHPTTNTNRPHTHTPFIDQFHPYTNNFLHIQLQTHKHPRHSYLYTHPCHTYTSRSTSNYKHKQATQIYPASIGQFHPYTHTTSFTSNYKHKHPTHPCLHRPTPS